MAEQAVSTEEHARISKALDQASPWLETHLKLSELRAQFDIEARGFLTTGELIDVFDAVNDTPREHVRKLLKILKTKSLKAFERFCDILKEHNYKDIAEQMWESYLAAVHTTNMQVKDHWDTPQSSTIGSTPTHPSTKLNSFSSQHLGQPYTSTPARPSDRSRIHSERKRRSTEPTIQDTEDIHVKVNIDRANSFPESARPNSSMLPHLPFTIEQMLRLEVVNVLAELDKNWDDFGLMMGLSQGDVKKIGDSYSSIEQKCVVMLELLEKKQESHLDSIFQMKMKRMHDNWSQKFLTEFQAKKKDCERKLCMLDSRIVDTPEKHISDEEQEYLFQSLSETDQFNVHYWRIGRLLPLPPYAMQAIEESHRCNQLNQRALAVLRKWKKNCGFSVRDLGNVLEYIDTELHTLLQKQLLSLSSNEELLIESAETDEEINSFPGPFAAILVGTAAEYKNVAAYFSQEDLIEEEGEFQKYKCSNDLCLQKVQISATVQDMHDGKYISHLLTITFQEKGREKSFVVYNPREGQAKQATSELLQMAKNHNWPLDQFYIVGSCSVYCAPELQKPLGYLVLAKYLDDYNSGDVVDNTVEFHSSPREMSKDLYDIIYNWSRYGPAEHSDWAIPYVHAERVCSAPRRMSSKEIATKLLGNDKYLAIEVDGVGLMTVKEVVDVLYENERRPMKYIVVKGASHFADKTLDGGKFLAKLFNCESKEYESEQRQKIATLHSIAFVTRCIVQRIPPGTGEKNSKSKSNFEKSLRTAELKFDFDEFFKVFQKKI